MTVATEKIAGVHRAIVVDNNDPEGLLRVKVSIASLAVNVSGWAWPAVPSTAGARAPEVQDPVWITFEDGDVNRPVYLGTWLPVQTPNDPEAGSAYIITGGTNVFPDQSATMFAAEVTGDVAPRFEARAGGQLRWGSGSAAADASLTRTGVGAMQFAASLSVTAGLTVTGPTTLAALSATSGSFTGVVSAASVTLTGALTAASASITGTIAAGSASITGALSAGAMSGTSLALTAPLPISSGGTGSATQNFVDLTTAQTIGGNKVFTAGVTVSPATTGNVALRADGLLGQTADLFQARVNGVGVGTITAGGKFIITGGIDLSGSPSGYAGGEIKFVGAAPSDTAPSIGTDATMMFFDHRRSNNTGGWAWRNNTSAAIYRMRLTPTGALMFNSDGTQATGLPAGLMGIGYDTVQFNIWDTVGGKGLRFFDTINNFARLTLDSGSNLAVRHTSLTYDPVRLEPGNARLWAQGDYGGIGISDAAGNNRLLFGLRLDIAGNTTDMVSYTYGGSIRFFPNGQETLRLNTDRSIWGGGTLGLNMFRIARSTQLTWETKDNADSGGAYWVAYADADGVVVGNDTWLLYGYPRNTSGGILGFEQILMFQFVNGKTASYYKQGSVNVPYFAVNAAPSTAYNFIVGGSQQITNGLTLSAGHFLLDSPSGQFRGPIQSNGVYVVPNTASYSVTSTTFIDHPQNPSMGVPNFDKRSSGSGLVVSITSSGWFATGSQWVEFGVQINGVDYIIAHFFFNQSGVHLQITGQRRVAAGLAAGVYFIKPRIRVQSGTFQQDTNDMFTMTIFEG